MLINTNLPTDPSASALRQSRAPGAPAGQTPPPSTQATASQFDLTRWQGLEGDTTVPDSAGADQAADFAQANFLAQPAQAVAAQANLNPESAYSLLQ
jgi:hypothetical protein